jgi:hypothetical protein
VHAVGRRSTYTHNKLSLLRKRENDASSQR